MPAKQINYFATKTDLINALSHAESKVSVFFARTGLFESRGESARLSKLSSWDRVGVNSTGQAAQADTFLIVLANAQFAIREVAQKKGGVRYAVDQKINPDSIAISLAGENLGALISGFIGTVSKTETSTNLYQDFSIAFFDGFETIKAYKVGPEALARLKTGERLVGNIRQPREYDLLLD